MNAGRGVDQLRAGRSAGGRAIPLHAALGIEIVELDVGSVTTRLPSSPHLRDRAGALVPGSLGILADTCCGAAIASALSSGGASLTAQLRVEFVRPLRAGTRWLEGRAGLDSVDDQGGLSRAELVDDHDELVAVSSLRSLTSSDRGAGGPIAEVGGLASAAQNDGVAAFLGLLSRSALDGRSDWRIGPGREVTNSFGALHGGMVALLAHIVATDAQRSVLAAGEQLVPLDLALNYFRGVPIGEGPVAATAEISHRGRRFIVADGQIFQADGRPAVSFSVGAQIRSE
jgi:uncharacterized protein (TIGR00369 family)